MNINPYQKFSEKVSMALQYAVMLILSLLLSVVLAAIFWATAKTMMGLLGGAFTKDIHEVVKHVMVNSLTILALLEVFRTALFYLKEGRVKVTYIIDTVIVMVLTEIRGIGLKEIEYMRMAMIIAFVLSLVIARILTIRFSPTGIKEES